MGFAVHDFEALLEFTLKKAQEYYPEFGEVEKKKIKKAFWYGYDKHAGQKRFSGEPYFIHPVKATENLFPIKPDIETIQACLLHDVLDDTDATEEDIKREFGAEVLFLVEGVSNVSKVQLKGPERELENIRKLFVAMAKDIRVVFIKLADRIHNLSTLEYVPEHKQKRIAKESLEVYAPVAAKLGLFEFKTQIEDYSFKHLYKDSYQKVSDEVVASRKEQHTFIEKAKEEISQVLEAENIEVAEIQGRPKNLYSIYTKMKRKGFSSVSEVFDLFAIRILVNNSSDCYRTLGVIHSNWHPIPKRFKDYISIPKPNGYQSLHTTILGFGKAPLEIQIKTVEMHQDAEYGPAAHWAYKHARHSNFDTDYVKRMDWFPQIELEEEDSAEKSYEKISQSILESRIYVFTPKGEIVTLPENSTPIDFAYSIHTDIGNNCVGAKVDGIIKPLDYRLSNGSVVEILTQKGRNPNPAWLNFVQSSRTIGKIKNYLNKQKTPSTAPEQEQKKQEEREKPRPRFFQKLERFITGSKSKPEIVIGGERNLPYRFVSCCKPKLGKDIIAYKTRGLDFSVHEADCKQLDQLEPERFLEAHFQIEKFFEATFKDRVGLLKDISKIIADHGINILQSNFQVDKNTNLAYWDYSIECTGDPEYKDVMKIIKSLPETVKLTEK